jgi:hypothetical protein
LFKTERTERSETFATSARGSLYNLSSGSPMSRNGGSVPLQLYGNCWGSEDERTVARKYYDSLIIGGQKVLTRQPPAGQNVQTAAGTRRLGKTAAYLTLPNLTKPEEQTELSPAETSPVRASVSEKPEEPEAEPEPDAEAEQKKRAEIEREWGPALDALLADKSVLAPGRIQLQTQANLQPAQKRPFADRFDTFQLACAECGLSTGSVQMERSNEEWAKLHLVDRVAAAAGLYERKHAGQFKETRYLPKPANYLRDRQWEDPIRYSADNEPFVDPVMAEYKRQDAENRARRAEREAKREVDDAHFVQAAV